MQHKRKRICKLDVTTGLSRIAADSKSFQNLKMAVNLKFYQVHDLNIFR